MSCYACKGNDLTLRCRPEKLLSFCLCVAAQTSLRIIHRALSRFAEDTKARAACSRCSRSRDGPRSFLRGSRTAIIICNCFGLHYSHHHRSYSLNEFTVFKCTIKLTDAGVRHWEHAVALVIEYMRIMRHASEGKLTQLYDEQTAIDAADFQFQSRQGEETYVDKLSNALLLYPPNLVLYGRQCCVEPVFDYAVFSQLLQHFNCGNMRVHVTAPLAQQPDPDLPWLSAPWYGTLYRVSPLTDSFAASLGATLASDGDLQAALEVAASTRAHCGLYLHFVFIC